MSRLDPVTLQVMLGALRAACDEMGAVLVRSAHSANIKERRDASTALFDERGRMVMQAEHIPVHLGAMPSAVAAVLDEDHEPGVAWILNDPYRGGTHLPDITVIARSSTAASWSASRPAARTTPTSGRSEPGSMPADSRSLADEGVVIPPTAARRRHPARAAARMRNPRQREADLRAQLAAGRAGAERVEALIERFGLGQLPGRAGGDARLRRAAHARPHRRAARRRAHGDRRARGGATGDLRAAARRRASTATRSRSTSPAPRPSTTATSTARSP